MILTADFLARDPLLRALEKSTGLVDLRNVILPLAPVNIVLDIIFFVTVAKLFTSLFDLRLCVASCLER